MIELGDLGKDSITGFEGVVIGYAEHLHNCDRVALQPRELKDGQPAKPVWFDIPQIEISAKAVVPVVAAEETEIELGFSILDPISKCEGVVVALITYISGCIRVGLQPTTTKDGLPVDECYFPASQLKIKEAGTFQPNQGRGGPMSEPKAVRDPN